MDVNQDNTCISVDTVLINAKTFKQITYAFFAWKFKIWAVMKIHLKKEFRHIYYLYALDNFCNILKK